jgi:O-succinylbenzoic acid--CoA ligase
MFVSGGENVQPEEVERVLCGLDGVERALVVPVEDEEYGQVGHALVKMEDDGEPDGDALKSRLKEVLPGYKIPRRFAKMPSEIVADKVNRTDVARKLELK